MDFTHGGQWTLRHWDGERPYGTFQEMMNRPEFSDRENSVDYLFTEEEWNTLIKEIF